jgi:tRNA (cytidine/uridine-2'-O-)-methyltransferase
MFHIVLVEPEIPPNTGNIIRLCANVGAHLHLIHPLGFELDDRQLRRAGLDYHEWVTLEEHRSIAEFLASTKPGRVFGVSTRGTHTYTDQGYLPGDAFVFGPESRGLSADFLDSLAPDRVLRVPMQPDSRSLNLSNAVSVVLYEAWRQNNFAGST